MNEKLPSVVIVGRPNVGKSALFNRLVRRKIATVHDQPGITRDRISGICSRGGRPFKVSDTGGIAGVGESELLRDVRRVVNQTIGDSDVLIFVVDGKDGLSPIDQEIARMLRRSDRPVILVVNKIDHDKHSNFAIEFDSLGFERNVAISAEHNRGISELIDQIEKLLPSPSESVQAPRSERPLAVAIVGRPNVGKSSLINSIVRNERAIVSELAGTTRDAIDISYEQEVKQFVFIDTAGIRRRSQHSSSVEVFSVMRAERSIRRADVCVLVVDLSSGVTAQDKRIAGLIQEAHKSCIVVLNKWDLFKPKRGEKGAIVERVKEARERLFFLDYGSFLVASALTNQNVDRLFGLIERIRAVAKKRIGTGVLNRLLRAAFAANPPPMRKGKRLKLFYAAQAAGTGDRLQPPEFVLFVNDPASLIEHYKRYLEGKIREAESYEGLPILLRLRPRTEKNNPRS